MAKKSSGTLTLLGCGNSTGVPIPTCRCAICRSRNSRNQRLRCSAWLQYRGKSLLIDTATDLRQQALRFKIPRVDAVLYTHPHTDHTHGIDELRAYNHSQNSQIPLYGNSWVCEDLERRFPYIFEPKQVASAVGVPLLALNLISGDTQTVEIQGVPITPLPALHGKNETLGYRIESVAYLTDCSYIPVQSLDRMKGLSCLVLDCLRIKPHGTHLNLDQALEVISKLRPKKTYLTHLGHDFDYAKWNRRLPAGVRLAYDGLKITL